MTLRILSSNAWRCDDNKPWWAERGLDCSATARTPILLRAYREIAPDVIGFQEVSRKMQALLAPALGPLGFEFVSGGDTPVAFRADRLKLLESGFFLFPENVPGLDGSFNNSETKSFTWCVFETRDAEKARFALVDMHLWWMCEERRPGSDAAREHQFRMASAAVAAAMERHGCPGIATGDFNAVPGSPCLRAAADLGWRDAHDLATAPDETKGTHPCSADGFAPRPEPGAFAESIDHVLVKDADCAVLSHRRLREPWFDPASDHYPLYCDLSF